MSLNINYSRYRKHIIKFVISLGQYVACGEHIMNV